MNVCIWRRALIARSDIPISFLANDSVTVETNVIFGVACDCRMVRENVLFVYERTKEIDGGGGGKRVSAVESERQCMWKVAFLKNPKSGN